MPVFYPGCGVNLTMRFDEALFKGEEPSAPVSAGDAAASLSSITVGDPTIRRESDRRKDENRAGFFLVGKNSPLSRCFNTMPRSCSVELPGYRQAGKFSMAFAFRDFPLDPRVFRAIGVEVFLGTVSSTDFARGMVAERDYGKLASLVAGDPENLVIAGVADTLKVTHGEKGSEVHIEGRGLQSIFLDAKISPKTLKELDVTLPIDQLVAKLLTKMPGYSEGKRIVKIDVSPANEWPDGKIPAVLAKEVITRINAGREGQQSNRGQKGDSATVNFWDLVVNFCQFVGAVPFFSGHVLCIRPARGLYDQVLGKQPGRSPFRGSPSRAIKTNTGDEMLHCRRMVYGSNLLSFTMERKLGGAAKLPTVRVVCADPAGTPRDKSRLIEVYYPPENAPDQKKADAASTSDVTPNGEGGKKEVLTLSYPGIKDKKRLTNIAHAVYEEVRRGELKGSASTKDLTSFGGSNADTDILRMRPGDAVDFVVDASGLRGFPPIVSELNLLASKSPEKAIDDVAARLGGDRALAKVIVGTIRGDLPGLQQTFRTSAVKFGWEAGTGCAVDFEFQNYIEVRNDLVNRPEDKAALPPTKPKSKLTATLVRTTKEGEISVTGGRA